MKIATCPSPQTLQRLLLGTLPREEREPLEEHLLQCDRCVANAETIVADDDLTTLTRSAAVSSENQSEGVLALIERIKAARKQAETMRLEETIVGQPASGASVAFVDGASTSLSFLGPAQGPDELGRLGEYRVLQVLGMGGMGVVLKAEDMRLKRMVALKTMKPSIASSRDAKSRFLREAQATAALEHDHIVPIYQVGEDRGVPYIAMQFLKGESLAKRLERLQRLSPNEVVRIGKEVALGLSCAHDAGMIHRDIKPDNIWLDEKKDRAKILDFGLVSATNEEEGLTQFGTVLGTPKYMAPEQALAYSVDHRADLFSLGSVLYHAAAGEPPFKGTSYTSMLMAVANQQPTALHIITPETPRDVATLITQLLEKDPDKRPQTATEVAEKFAELEHELRQLESPASALPLVHATGEERLMPASQTANTPRKPPQRKLLLAAAGGFAALVLGVLVITIRDKDGKETVMRVTTGTDVDVDMQPGSKVTIREEATRSDKEPMSPASLDSNVQGSGAAMQPATIVTEQITPSSENVNKDLFPSANMSRSEIDVASEQKIALRLQRLQKGTFLLGNKDQQPVPAWNLINLPSEPFCILEADLSGCELTDDEIVALKGCQSLRRLVVSGNAALTQAGFERLEKLPTLVTLDAHATAVNNGIFAWLADCPAIKTIDLRETNLSAGALQSMPVFESLHTLRLPAAVSNEDLKRLTTTAPYLRELAAEVSDPTMIDTLEGNAHLVKLSLSARAISADSIQQVKKLEHLESLVIHEPTREAVALLPQLNSELVSLELIGGKSESELTSVDLRPLAEMTQLVHLKLKNNMPVDASVLADLSELKWLRSISLDQVADDTHIAFRNRRPNVELVVGERRYPALSDWPGKFEGHLSIDNWELPTAAPKPAILPFTPEEAAMHQSKWAAFLGVPVESENSLGMKFCLIPPGEYNAMSRFRDGRRLATAERLAAAYEIGTTEVTVEQFEVFVKATGYQTEAEQFGVGYSKANDTWQARPEATWRTPGYELRPNMPVTVVSAVDAQAFCEWLSKTDKRTYRLPTPAEWEFASRGGGQQHLGWCTHKNAAEYDWSVNHLPSDESQPVGGKKANPFGLHDVLGNVYEITQGAGVSLRVGSSWGVPLSDYSDLGDRDHNFGAAADSGFRIVRENANSTTSNDSVVRIARNTPLSSIATVSRPTAIPGVRSWSVEWPRFEHFAECDWSPQGDLIAVSGGHAKTVQLYAPSGTIRSVLLGHKASVTCVVFSPDGKLIASGAAAQDSPENNELRLWETATGKCLWTMRTRTWISDLTWSSDGQWIAIAGPNNMSSLINVSTKIQRAFHLPGATNFARRQLSFSADSRRLFIANKGNVYCLNVANNTLEDSQISSPNAAETETADRVAVSPDGQWLAGTTQAGKLRFWDLKTNQFVRELQLKSSGTFSEVFCLQWSPDSKRIAIARAEAAIDVVALAPETEPITFSCASGQMFFAAWSPTSGELVSAYDGRLNFLDVESARVVRQGPPVGWNRGRLFLSENSTRLIYNAREFDTASGLLVSQAKDASQGSRWTIAPNDQWRGYRSSDRDFKIVPKALDRDTVIITTMDETHRWRSSPSGAQVAYAEAAFIRVCDSATGTEIAKYEHPTRPMSLEWSPDGSLIATLCEDKVLRVWDVSSAKTILESNQAEHPIQTFYVIWNGSQVISWLPDSKSLEVPLPSSILRIDVPSGRWRTRPNAWSDFRNAVGLLAGSPNHERLHIWEGYGSSHLLSQNDESHEMGYGYGWNSCWHRDSRRLIGLAPNGDVLRAYDTVGHRPLGTLFPDMTEGHWLCIGPTGHCRGSKGVAEHIVYVAQLDDGSHITLSPQEFTKRFDWRNDPEQATLMASPD